MRLNSVTEISDHDLIEIVIDGQSVVVPPGTTIFDAARRLGITIPTLCHDDLLPPSGGCRLCVVDVGEPNLTPACCRTVDSLPDASRITTHRASDRVRQTVETLLELLLAERADWKPGLGASSEWMGEEWDGRQKSEGRGQKSVVGDQKSDSIAEEFNPQSSILNPHLSPSNAVIALAERFGLSRSRFASRPVRRDRDDTSPIISVDRSACILCHRCVHTCGEVQHHEVISRAGRGDAIRIVFDLDRPLGDSSCEACGACVPQCPTGALAFRLDIQPAGRERTATSLTSRVTAAELQRHPLFSGIGIELLDRLAAIIVRRQFAPGEVIAHEAERGSTAFLLEVGEVQLSIDTPSGHVHSWKDPESRRSWGPLGLVRRFVTTLEQSVTTNPNGTKRSDPSFIPLDAPVYLPRHRPIVMIEAGQMWGEMTAMCSQPRSATARAVTVATVLELPREAVYVLRQNPASRSAFDQTYLERTLSQHLVLVPALSSLAADAIFWSAFVSQLRPHVRLERFAPGDVIVRRGDLLDTLRLIRFGHVQEVATNGGEDHVLRYLGPGRCFGDEPLSDLDVGEVESPTTWRAITAVDVASIHFKSLRQVMATLPPSPPWGEGLGVRGGSRTELTSNSTNLTMSLDGLVLDRLSHADHLVTIDLARCIHCDDCVRACGAAHDGVTRLVPDGLRFDNRLLPTTCITCLNPVCLIGCPVGAIERLASREIAIADWCIGCRVCAEQCPYGNLVMHPVEAGPETPSLALRAGMDTNPQRKRGTAVVDVTKPTTCDVCLDLVGEQPPCVAACAHEAIHRVTGPQFVERAT
ncbi:MAG: cyclic nucleotide-binding domain-containing protein [Planctomycetales bacterium]|nr:cyclic nucleotide-binding domain-containing protein [Planctomycetales bacterium]